MRFYALQWCDLVLLEPQGLRYIAGTNPSGQTMSSVPTTPASFKELMAQVTARLQGRALDADLERALNGWFPVEGSEIRTVWDACRAGIAEGWMCSRAAGGIRFGRVIKAGPDTHGFSVDVVDMEPVVGPHHRHPNGEIDLIMPMSDAAQFDGHGAGWLVYGAGSSHCPTVTGGRALVLYLLPGGAIEFTSD